VGELRTPAGRSRRLQMPGEVAVPDSREKAARGEQGDYPREPARIRMPPCWGARLRDGFRALMPWRSLSETSFDAMKTEGRLSRGRRADRLKQRRVQAQMTSKSEAPPKERAFVGCYP